MARRGTRKGARGPVGYIYNPIRQVLRAVNNTTSATTNTVKRVVHNGITGVDTIGNSVSRRANNTLRGLVPRGILRRRRGTRRGTRRSRK